MKSGPRVHELLIEAGHAASVVGVFLTDLQEPLDQITPGRWSGQVASAAAVISLAGAKGKRYALPNARILLHQPHGGVEGQAVDIEIQAKEMIRNRELMNEIIAKHTGQPMERVSKDTDRDFILTASR